MQIIETGADRLVKDSRLFRDSVQGIYLTYIYHYISQISYFIGLLKSGADFGKAFETIFQPMQVTVVSI